jgi:hypothetical protein
MPVTNAARLSELATNGVFSLLKHPLEVVGKVSLSVVNTAFESGGYSRMYVSAGKYYVGDDCGGPSKRFVEVPEDRFTGITDQAAEMLVQLSKSGHVIVEALDEPMATLRIYYPVKTDQIKDRDALEHVVTSLSLVDNFKIYKDESFSCCIEKADKKDVRLAAGEGGTEQEVPLLYAEDPRVGKKKERSEAGMFANFEEDTPANWLDEVGNTAPVVTSEKKETVRDTTCFSEGSDTDESQYSTGEMPAHVARRIRKSDEEGKLKGIESVPPKTWVGMHIPPGEVESMAGRLYKALRENRTLKRDDVGAVDRAELSQVLGWAPEEIDHVVWASQGSMDRRFERNTYGDSKLVMIRIRGKAVKKTFGKGEFMDKAYNQEAAKNVVLPFPNGEKRNTLGLFRDLFKNERFDTKIKHSGPAHNPLFEVEINFRCFKGTGTGSTLRGAKSGAMGQLIAVMLHEWTEPEVLAYRNKNFPLKRGPAGIEMNNKTKAVFRAYGCIGQTEPECELLRMVIDCLQNGPMSAKGLARTIGVPIRSINQVCYYNRDRLIKTSDGWDLATGEASPFYDTIFGQSASATVVGKSMQLRECIEFLVQVPARYANVALEVTAGNSATGSMAYAPQRFRTMLVDDPRIPANDIATYVSVLTLLAFVSRHGHAMDCTGVTVDYRGFVDESETAELTNAEKHQVTEAQKRPRSGALVLASYGATDFTGDFEDVRVIVQKSKNPKNEEDQPEVPYKGLQVAPNYFGVLGPLDTTSPTTLLSGIMRHFSNGEKELCQGVISAIKKHELEKKQRLHYEMAMRIIAEGDVALFLKHVEAGRIGPDCQTPPSRFTQEEADALYVEYSDWYHRVGKDNTKNRAYLALGVAERLLPEVMKTFCKPGENDDRARLIQPTRHNPGHTVCNGSVVKVIAETVKLSRPANLFKGMTHNGKRFYFGKFRKVAHEQKAGLFCFDRSKQDWLTSVMLLELYEDYMNDFAAAMSKAGFDKIANTIYSTKNKATICTVNDFVLMTAHADAMLTSACAQTSDANRVKTEVETLAYLFSKGWPVAKVKAVYDSWNNPEHRTQYEDFDNNLLYVPNEKMILPMIYEGDDTTIMDKHNIFEMENSRHCIAIAAFNSLYSTSWVPSKAAYKHDALSPIDTLSVLYYCYHIRDNQDGITKSPSGQPDTAVPHPVKKAQALATMFSPANIRFKTEENGIVNAILDDKTRIAIVTAKNSQAEEMVDALWLRRIAVQAAEWFLNTYEDKQYMSTAGPIWDPRDMEARKIVESYETPVVKRLCETHKRMVAAEGDKEVLIANADAWRLTCPQLAKVPLITIAEELAILDADMNAAGISKDDFDIRYSFERVLRLAPHIARVCDQYIGGSVDRLEKIGGEGTTLLMEQQKEAVRKLLAMSGGGAKQTKNESAAKEQNPQRHGPQRKQVPYGGERRGAPSSHDRESRGDRDRGGKPKNTSNKTWRTTWA